MCLELYVIPATEKKVSAERLARASGLWAKKVNNPVKGAIRFSRDGSCSCSLLADDADWDKPIWALEDGVPEELAAALQLLRNEAGGLTLRAIWKGDEAETEGELSLSQMLDEVRSNRVRNRHTCKVRT